MKKKLVVAGLLLALILGLATIAPPTASAQTLTQAELRVQYDNILRQLINLLLAQVRLLTDQLNALEAQQAETAAALQAITATSTPQSPQQQAAPQSFNDNSIPDDISEDTVPTAPAPRPEDAAPEKPVISLTADLLSEGTYTITWSIEFSNPQILTCTGGGVLSGELSLEGSEQLNAAEGSLVRIICTQEGNSLRTVKITTLP